MPERAGLLGRYRHVQLLVALALLLVVEPFVKSYVGELVVDVFLLLTIVSVVIACSRTRRHLIVGLTLAVLVQASQFYRAIHEPHAIGTARLLLAISLFGYVTALVLADVFRRGTRVSADTICGALAVYLLLGVIWTFAYTLLESLQPGSFSGLVAPTGPSATTDYQRFLGYSFVTLTTLGYGNVVPANGQADALAISEAILGQVYLTVLVARLVALNLIEGDGGAARVDTDS